MRNAFAREMTRLSAIDKRVVLLSGDIGNRLFDDLKAADPDRFYNCGVAEANMMGVAAGLALSGFRPVVYTITPFTTTRCFEQIRVDVCYHEAPVIIVGTGSGLSYAKLGPTHHSLEDLAILRTLPGLCVLAPCDAYELQAMLPAALAQNHPVYIRIGKKGEPLLHAQVPAFSMGKALVMRPGKTVGLLGTGTILSEVLKAADLLMADGISAEVVSFPCIKPLDEAYLSDAAQRFDCLVTVEEHGVIGGFGSAVAEWRASAQQETPLICLGTPDTFMHEVGSQTYARQKYGLNASSIADRVRQALQ